MRNIFSKIENIFIIKNDFKKFDYGTFMNKPTN